jgi:hypothetical protein
MPDEHRQHFLVLSTPPDGVTDAQFDAWYDTHVDELLERVPQFVAAERCHLARHAGEEQPYRFLTRYTIEGDFDAAWQGLRSAVDGGGMTFEAWFPQVRSAGLRCTTVTERSR